MNMQPQYKNSIILLIFFKGLLHIIHLLYLPLQNLYLQNPPQFKTTFLKSQHLIPAGW